MSADQVNTDRSVVVIGSTVASVLFSDGSEPVGQIIRVNGLPFTVIGVLKPTGGGGFGSNDTRAFIPLSLAQSRIFNAKYYRGEVTITGITIQVDTAAHINQAQTEIEQILRLRHGLKASSDNDFNIFNQASLLDVANGVASTLTVFLGSIGAVSLLVGGIGIMNIMLVSVTERTREIGLRRALGAHDSDILYQFLVEALVICTLGGAIGMALSYGTAYIFAHIPNSPFHVVIEPYALILALGVSFASGFVFGLYPAMRATKLDPIEALRFE